MHRDPIAGFRDPLVRIDVTPFLGVVLVLLVIYMVITPGEGGHIDIPETHTSAEMRRGMVTIHLSAYNMIYVEGAPSGEPVRQAEIEHHLRSALQSVPAERRATVYLNADRDARYADVLSVLDAVSRNGVRRVGLITVPPRD